MQYKQIATIFDLDKICLLFVPFYSGETVQDEDLPGDPP